MKKKLIASLTSFFLCASFLFMSLIPAHADAVSEQSVLPKSVDMSQEKYFPQIGEQVSSSCAGWATAYYQFTYQVARMNDWNVKEDTTGQYTFTPRYLWTYLNGGQDDGTTIEECIKLLSKKGCLRWSEFPELNGSFSWYQNENEQVTSDVMYRALENRVSNYTIHDFENFSATAPIITSVNSQKIVEIKTLLNSGHCLSFGTHCYDAIPGVLPSQNGQYAGQKVICNPRNEYGGSGHAMTIVGYNDDIWYDLNGDGIAQSYEKGALKIADSNKRGNNDGFMWIMYDALNRVSNVSELNSDKRQSYIFDDYYSIEVQHYSPKLTVELTIEQNKKNDISITLGRSDTLTSEKTTENTFLQALGGPISFYSTQNIRAAYTEIFDYSVDFADYDVFSPDEIHDLFDGYDKYYWINIQDIDANNDATTTVKRIIWRNENKEIVKEITPNQSIDGTTVSYESKTVPVNRLSLNKNSSFLATGSSEQLTATISPDNADNPSIEWISGNSGVVTVSNLGQVTAVGKGTATVIARTTDGSNLTDQCSYKVVDVPVTRISVSRTRMTLHENQTANVSATVVPTNADDTTVTWSSDNSEVAEVSTTGVIRTKNKGYVTISATANDGSGVTAKCYVTVIDDHGDMPHLASTARLHTALNGEIELVGDVDYFKFVPDETTTYIFYSTGSTDTVGYLYDRNNTQLVYNNNAGITAGNFAFKYSLEEGKTYYIKVGSYGSSTGVYTLNITKGIYSTSLLDLNQDARHVQMQAEASSILTLGRVWIDGELYSLQKPASGNLETTVRGVRFKVTFTSARNGYSTIWNIHAEMPSSQTEKTVYFAFLRGSVGAVESEDINGFLPYKSSIKTGIDPNSNLRSLMNSMQTAGYTLTARNWDNSLITVNSTVKAATGMKIIKTDSTTGKIVEVYYLVLFGDVTGNGEVGDGLINSSDSLEVLQEVVNNSKLPTEIARLAADVDHDGQITEADSNMILNATVGSMTINQNFVIDEVPDECSYNTIIEF